MVESSSYILDIKRTFGLSTQLAAVLELLLLKAVVNKEDLKPLFSTFHGDKPHHSVNRMILYRLRKELESMNICVFSQYGEGYYLKVSDKAYLRGVLEGIIEAPGGLTPRRA
jgi:hypothetical protein